MQIQFFWVWAAINEINDNTSFLIKDWENNLQVDCGWWKTLTKKIKFNNIRFNNLFITHKHTDHILWFFHLIRVFNKYFLSWLNIYCSSDVKKTLIDISNSLWWQNKSLIEYDNVKFFEIDDLYEKNIWDFIIIPINLNSKKIEQHWFLLENKWKKILFFWDEAVWVLERTDLEKYIWVDYLIVESICTESMAIRSWWFVNNEKITHITSKDAWKIANKLQVKNLILFHTMDIDEDNRQKLLIQDAKTEFDWNIIVPNSWDIIKIF